MEIQAIVIRAPAGLQGASEQESTIKEADCISKMGSLRMYRPVNAQCSSSSELPEASFQTLNSKSSKYFSEGS